MGGGQPLPPPGTPLPMPDRKGKITVVGGSRRGGTSSTTKPAAPPAHPPRLPSGSSSSVPLSKRRHMRQQLDSPVNGSDRVLVVEAPAIDDSEPTTPGEDGYTDAWAGDDDDDDDGDDEGASAWMHGGGAARG
ncbi:hypothetical protein MAPG_10654 [Magnaporthiopsis poae ATCC 64411]|uniref:Uncharacterized protein n=1 Tax=Magnaporthiopsis poae (strain ATCC 64411 / 73-15) TaxID=644358 RepID=A0A0C4ED61_MAGP6|nr:hypothetical protein MAPG_10654 [Magnaporthiopsis poae ATCC 64411]